jgi:hypothetical protein
MTKILKTMAIATIAVSTMIGCTPREGIHYPDESKMVTEVSKIVQVEDASGSHLFQYVELSNGCVVVLEAGRRSVGKSIDCR